MIDPNDEILDAAPAESPREWKLRAGALPTAIVLALMFHSCDTGHFVQRSALSMPLHELGHAVTGWFCGFAAVPSLWKTLIPESRSVLVPAVLAAGNAFLVWRGWTSQRTWMCVVGLALGALQLVAYTSRADTAAVAFTFGGDAGAMVLGTLLMLTFFVGPGSRLRAGGLRFGLLAIGAAGFVDAFATWWTARHDPSVIPFGEIEGVGLSDPSKLTEVFGWSQAQVVDRYVTLGTLCLLVLAVVWLWQTLAARPR